jgi:hypothetical protein
VQLAVALEVEAADAKALLLREERERGLPAPGVVEILGVGEDDVDVGGVQLP